MDCFTVQIIKNRGMRVGRAGGWRAGGGGGITDASTSSHFQNFYHEKL